MYGSTQFDEGRPMGHGSVAAMEAALTGISGMLFVCFLLSVVWMSSLRGIRSCGGRHYVSVLAWACLGCSFLGLFLLLGFD